MLQIDTAATPDAVVAERIKSALFVSSPAELASAVPDYWRGYFERENDPPEADAKRPTDGEVVEVLADGTEVRTIGGAVKPARVIQAKDPVYPEIAKKLRYQGVSVVGGVLGTDGRFTQLRVVRALGLGLDDEAIRVVKTWTFHLATLNGVPVAVQVNVEVSFRLF